MQSRSTYRMKSVSAADNDVLIFLHVPKTAGTTLNRIIESQYNPLRIYSIPGGWGSRRSTRKLREMPAHRLNPLQVVKGHLEFGMHRYLLRPATYMTMLREPVDRIVSSYYYALSHRFHPLHRILTAEKMSLAQFVELAPWIHNLQVKLIGGVPMSEINPAQALDAARRGEIMPWEQFVGRHCDAELATAAMQNLARHFSVIGLTERFAESLALMKIAYGWQLSGFQKFRTSKRRPAATKLSSETVDRIRRLNEYDIGLYEVACTMFEERLEQNSAEVQEILTLLETSGRPRRWMVKCQEALAWTRFGISLARSAI